MSLYNMLFGENPFAELLLHVLGTTRDRVPRYRDCFLTEEGNIVIHTRTGGGNRDLYDSAENYKAEYPEASADELQGPFNEHLRALPGFQGDADDDFDSTYANFTYEVPAVARDMVKTLQTLGAVSDPAARWQETLEKLRTGDVSDPVVQRSMQIAEGLAEKINAMKGAS